MKYNFYNFSIIREFGPHDTALSFFSVFIEAEGYGRLRMPLIFPLEMLLKNMERRLSGTACSFADLSQQAVNPDQCRQEDFDFIPHLPYFITEEYVEKVIDFEKNRNLRRLISFFAE